MATAPWNPVRKLELASLLGGWLLSQLYVLTCLGFALDQAGVSIGAACLGAFAAMYSMYLRYDNSLHVVKLKSKNEGL